MTCPTRVFIRITANPNIGALIIRTGFWGPLYYNHNKEPQNSIGNYYGPYSSQLGCGAPPLSAFARPQEHLQHLSGQGGFRR